mmetsp:Transcript_1343/g.2456  ORF Transcript_1343/g.2456 Transcript_1343/m.2456 type:complete len:300 (-) Transcript_1343:26-925(-)
MYLSPILLLSIISTITFSSAFSSTFLPPLSHSLSHPARPTVNEKLNKGIDTNISSTKRNMGKSIRKLNTIPRGGGVTEIPRPPGLLRRTFPTLPWHLLPDILTYIRLLSIPLLVLLFHLPFSLPLPTILKLNSLSITNHHACAFIYAMAGYTDYLDGYLARLWSITSSFGAFLDPVADKLMVSTTLILLSGLYGTLVSVPTAVIIAREIGVSALREWMSGRGMRETVKVGWQGKVKTALTMVSSTLLLAVDTDVISGVMDGVWKIGIFGLYASMVLTVTSGWGYFQAAKGELMKERKIG